MICPSFVDEQSHKLNLAYLVRIRNRGLEIVSKMSPIMILGPILSGVNLTT